MEHSRWSSSWEGSYPSHYHSYFNCVVGHRRADVVVESKGNPCDPASIFVNHAAASAINKPNHALSDSCQVPLSSPPLCANRSVKGTPHPCDPTNSFGGRSAWPSQVEGTPPDGFTNTNTHNSSSSIQRRPGKGKVTARARVGGQDSCCHSS